MSSSNQMLVKTIPLHPIFIEEEQSVKDCSLSNKVKNGQKVDYRASLEKEKVIKQALEEKERIIKEAQEERERILLEAQAEVLQIKTEAEKNGYNIGFEKGFTQAEEKNAKEYEDKLNNIRMLINNDYQAFLTQVNQTLQRDNQWIVDNVSELVKFSIDNILHDNKAIQSERVANIVRELADDLLERGLIFIRVSPNKVSEITKVCQQTGIMEDGRRVRVASDSSLSETDCIIETELERLEFKLEDELDALIKEIERVSE